VNSLTVVNATCESLGCDRSREETFMEKIATLLKQARERREMSPRKRHRRPEFPSSVWKCSKGEGIAVCLATSCTSSLFCVSMRPFSASTQAQPSCSS
jgi:hypothetical protein